MGTSDKWEEVADQVLSVRPTYGVRSLEIAAALRTAHAEGEVKGIGRYYVELAIDGALSKDARLGLKEIKRAMARALDPPEQDQSDGS